MTLILEIEMGGQHIREPADLAAAHRPYIQSAALNGRPFERSVLRHWEILAGGRLEFRMGAEPNRAWGVGPGRQPRSRIEGAPVTVAPVVTGQYRLGDVRHIVASAERARTELGFSAEIDPADGLPAFATAPLRE